MSADTTTPFDHVHDTLASLKPMRDYSKGNVERLSTQWLRFDGELRKLRHAERIEDPTVRAAELHDAIEAEIVELEALSVTLRPATEDGAPAGATRH